MSFFRKFTEGGQTWTHQLRMFRQVTKTAIFSSILFFVMFFGYFMSKENRLLYQSSWYYLKAYVLNDIFKTIEVDKNVWSEISHEFHSEKELQITPKRVIQSTEPYVVQLQKVVKRNLKTSGLMTFISFISVVFFFILRGQFSRKKQHISGKTISSPWRISFFLKFRKKASDLKLGSLSLIKDSETQHILVTGGTGSGKTNCFHHILPQIRKRSQKAVVVDVTGVLVEKYFRPGKDIILNPLDKRGVSWHPWGECENASDYESLAEGFIPNSFYEHDNYWRTASRSLFHVALSKISNTKKTSEIVNWLLFESLPNLCAFVKGTEAAAHIDMNSEKTAGSVRSVASSFLRCLKVVQDTDNPFSIQKWVEASDDDSWLFLSCTPDQRESINPLLSCWFSVATRSLIRLKPDFKRRLWFIVDELPKLNKLKGLEDFLTEGRKYGGCMLLALQSPAQLESIYGRESTRTILGNCATKIIFSDHDPEIAEKISRCFGSREIKEYQQGISYGANEVRDGVNLTSQTKSISLVSATDIQSLEPNEAFVKLPGNVPIAKIKLKIVKA